MIKKIFLLVAFLVIALSCMANDNSTRNLSIKSIEAKDNNTVAKIYLKNYFNRDLQDALEGGVELRYRFIFTIKNPRSFWFDKKIKEYEVDKSIQYDGLRRVYTLSTKINGNEVTIDEHSNKDLAMLNFSSYIATFSNDYEPGTYVLASAYLKEFTNWFPVRVFVNTFADWEFETSTISFNLLATR